MNFWGIIETSDSNVARVIGEGRELWRLGLVSGAVLVGKMRGHLRWSMENSLERPIVGDWVEISSSGSDDFVMIERVLPRSSVIKRLEPGESGALQPIVANVDVLMIATSANEDFNLRRLERYVAMAFDAGVVPMVLLTKMDLNGNSNDLLSELMTSLPGISVLGTQLLPEPRTQELLSHLKPGQTTALIGSSGVGKSSLINALLGREALATSAIRDQDDRGRHTTTSRTLWRLPQGSLLVDNPGLREIQLQVSEEALSDSFQDVQSFIGRCRFGDCQHRTEPDCQVLLALENGSLGRERWESYCKLQREMNFHLRKKDPAFWAEERKRWKTIHNQNRLRKKPIF